MYLVVPGILLACSVWADDHQKSKSQQSISTSFFIYINVSSRVGPLQKKVGVLHDNKTDFFSATSLTWCVTGATSLKHHSPSTWPVFWLEHWSWAPWLTGMDHYPYVMTLIKCKSTLNSFSVDLLTHVKNKLAVALIVVKLCSCNLLLWLGR